jgi:hypothetical protein
MQLSTTDDPPISTFSQQTKTNDNIKKATNSLLLLIHQDTQRVIEASQKDGEAKKDEEGGPF